VKDNFIVAAGGLASIKDKISTTNLTQIYDIKKEEWL